MEKDNIGMFCSGLCLCHCLATPFLFALGGVGLLGEVFHSEYVHIFLAFPVLGLVGITFPSSYRQHRCAAPFVLGVIGAGLILCSFLVSHATEHYFSVFGGLLLFSAHFTNRHFLKRAPFQTEVQSV